MGIYLHQSGQMYRAVRWRGATANMVPVEKCGITGRLSHSRPNTPNDNMTDKPTTTPTPVGCCAPAGGSAGSEYRNPYSEARQKLSKLALYVRWKDDGLTPADAARQMGMNHQQLWIWERECLRALAYPVVA